MPNDDPNPPEVSNSDLLKEMQKIHQASMVFGTVLGVGKLLFAVVAGMVVAAAAPVVFFLSFVKDHYDEKISDLRTLNQSLQSQLETSVVSLNASISENSEAEKIEAAEKKLGDFESRVASVDESLGEMRTDLTGLNVSIFNVEEKLNENIDLFDTALNSVSSSLDASISELSDELDGLKFQRESLCDWQAIVSSIPMTEVSFLDQENVTDKVSFLSYSGLAEKISVSRECDRHYIVITNYNSVEKNPYFYMIKDLSDVLDAKILSRSNSVFWSIDQSTADANPGVPGADRGG
ncbi:MAG: hypothetical protein AAGA12_12830 [Pseudomonadota bacterium]